MKKGKKIICILAAIIVILFLLWKLPFYYILNQVKLPENCKTFQTKVVLTDVYTVHILGEKVIVSDMNEEELEKYIQENNSQKWIKHISVSPFFREWDDFAVFPEDYEEEIPEEEKGNYYVITYYLKL